MNNENNLNINNQNFNNLGYNILISNNNIYVDNLLNKKVLSIDKLYNFMYLLSDFSEFEQNIIIEQKHIDAILGIIEINKNNFLLIVYESEFIGNLNNIEIFRIKKVELISLSQNKNVENEDNFYLIKNNLQFLLQNNYFYYAIGEDISRSFQEKNSNENSIYNCNKDFTWNYELLNKFFKYKIEECFISCLICGYFSMKKNIIINNNYNLDLILFERIHKNSMKISSIENIENLEQNKINSNDSFQLKQIEFICILNEINFFSFIFYKSFFDINSKNFKFNLTNIQKFNNKICIIDNSNNYNQNNINIILQNIMQFNNINNNIKIIKLSNNNDFINFFDNNNNNNYNNLINCFSYYSNNLNEFNYQYQTNLFWLFNINVHISNNIFNLLVRLLWLNLQKNFNLCSSNFFIGPFSKSNNNIIITKFKELLGKYYSSLNNNIFFYKNKINKLKSQISIDYLLNHNSDIKKIPIKKNITLLVTTWNLGGIPCDPIDYNDLTEEEIFNKFNNSNFQNGLIYNISPLITSNTLYKNYNSNPDIIAFGFQEIVKLNIKNILKNNSQKEAEFWGSLIYRTIKKIYPNDEYYNVIDLNLVGIYLVIFAKESLRNEIKILDQKIIKNGALGTLGNKGNLIVNLQIYENKIGFASGHYIAGQKKIEDRLNMLDEVLESKMKINENEEISFENLDMWFIFGDLNFRIDKTYEEVINNVKNMNLKYLFNYDQLNIVTKMYKNKYFKIDEGEINFNPTYKYEKNLNCYIKDTDKKQRIPSWCDRIIFKKENKEHENQIQIIEYDTSNVFYSDHRPVFALFKLTCKSYIKQDKDLVVKKMKTVEEFENMNLLYISNQHNYNDDNNQENNVKKNYSNNIVENNNLIDDDDNNIMKNNKNIINMNNNNNYYSNNNQNNNNNNLNNNYNYQNNNNNNNNNFNNNNNINNYNINIYNNKNIENNNNNNNNYNNNNLNPYINHYINNNKFNNKENNNINNDYINIENLNINDYKKNIQNEEDSNNNLINDLSERNQIKNNENNYYDFDKEIDNPINPYSFLPNNNQNNNNYNYNNNENHYPDFQQ